jgi:hypothetical protein
MRSRSSTVLKAKACAFLAVSIELLLRRWWLGQSMHDGSSGTRPNRIREYIKHQEQEDQRLDQMRLW